MIKSLLAIAIIAAFALGGWQLYKYRAEIEDKSHETPPAPAATALSSDTTLPGLPYALEAILAESRKKGALGLKGFLVRYGKSISDPRLAAIELDYVVLVTPKDPADAKKVFARVKQRTLSASPVYPRIQKLEKTYE